MKYICLIYDDEGREEAPEVGERRLARYMELTSDMRDAGVFVDGSPLPPTSTATTVRVRAGDRLVTDGPFAETKEVLLGFYMIDCDDLDAALDWAARIPTAESGSIEVRPLFAQG